MSENPSQEGYIPVTCGRVWFRRIGTGPGVPLLTLHGGPGGSSSYFESLTALADQRPVILYDQLGGGKADRPDDPNLCNLPPKYVPLLMLVPPAEIGKVGPGLFLYPIFQSFV